MNRQEFLQLLETELASVPNDERIAALQYFTMYFDDAGPEHEQDVIAELGSPQKIAKDIKSSAGYDFSESWTPPVTLSNEPTKTAEQNTSPFAYPPAPTAPLPPNSTYNNTNYAGSSYSNNAPTPSSENSTLKIILIIVLSPIWISLAAVALSLFVAAVIILAIPIIIGISFIFSGIVVAVSTSFLFAVSLGNSLVSLGIGIILLGAGLLLMWGGVLLIKNLVPLLCKGISSLFYTLFPKKGVA